MNDRRFNVDAFCGGFDRNFTYLVSIDGSDKQFIIDAGVPLREMEENIKAPVYLILTHTHGDHTAFLNDYLVTYPHLKIGVYKDSGYIVPPETLLSLDDGDEVTIEGLRLKVLHTPGHYPDSICLLTEDVLFTGDTLFVGRTGRTVGPRSDTRELYRSVYGKLLILPGSTIIYPGHDYGAKTSCTLSENINMSPLLQASNEGDFVRRMEEFEVNR